MTRPSIATAACAGLLVLVLAAPGAARESVKLKSGRTLVGDVQSQNDEEVVLRTAAGVLRLPRAQIESITELKDAETAKAKARSDPKPVAAETGKGGGPAQKDVTPDTTETEPAASTSRAKPATPGSKGSPALTADTSGSSAPSTESTVAPNEEWDAEVVLALGHRLAKNRAAAAQSIVDAWPGSARALDMALKSKNKAVRLAAVRLLGRDELGDTQVRVRRALSDRHPPVRQMAARAIRYRRLPMERDLIALVRDDPEARVALEAIRSLEEVGSWRCFRTLYRRWNNESDEELKRRYQRNLRRFLGVDHGSDAAAWSKAVEDAVETARTEQK